jgi:mono/diheme cytochrome c family protein
VIATAPSPNPRTILSIAIAAAFLFVSAMLLPEATRAAETGSADSSESALFLEGRYVYQRNCILCHGRWGNGGGEMAASLIPRPRDFTKGIFKYRSTPSGFLPTDADLERTIRNGLAGTAMPTFVTLRDSEIRAVIRYLKSFSAKWRVAANHSPPIPLPDPPPWLEDEMELPRRAAKGRRLFESTCAACHGADGSGKNNLPPDSLEDAWGRTSVPADLRQPFIRSTATASEAVPRAG